MICRPSSPLQQATMLPDLMPLLDVIFIVLVFFLLTAQAPLRQLPIALSQTSASLQPLLLPEQRVELTLLASGQWQVDGSADQDWSAVERYLAERDMAELALTVMTDRTAPLDAFMTFLVWLKQQPIEDVDIVLGSKND